MEKQKSTLHKEINKLKIRATGNNPWKPWNSENQIKSNNGLTPPR